MWYKVNAFRSRNRISVLLFLLIALFSMQLAMGQDSRSTLSSEKKQLEKEIAEQKKLLESTKKNKATSLREIELIKNQIKKQEKLIQVINEEIHSLDNQIIENTKELDILTKKLNLLTAEYKKAVYVAYKYRNTLSKASFVLSAANFNQAIQRMNYLQEYSRSLNAQLKSILETQQKIKQKDEQLNLQKKEKASLMQDKNKEKEQLAKQETEKNSIVSSLKKQESKINAEINKRISRQKQIDAAIQRIIDEEIAKQRKAEEAKKKNTPTTPTTTSTTAKTTTTAPAKTYTLTLTPEESALASDFESNKGKLPWPVEKGTVSVGFGSSNHSEVSSVQIKNSGINILTEKSASVRAVFKGTVAGVFDIDDGKAVLIRHGNYISVYSNLASVDVKKGDQVATKQQIGKIRNEASKTYSELHFEIRKEKDPLNPSLWIMKN
ncbi:MAG: peptidoglycan DD-metalloendopeptidase family protein [Lentimicrobiaceae bacterium]|nr:peptidoglycan DD-metalloendopeptidase family protein [Lentimicrobiaceae bacterium]